MAQINPDILQRILVAKHLLAANRDQLTPNSDATAVARAVLGGHDAAELAVAAIASHLKVPGLTDKLFLTDYASRIEDRTGKPLPGSEYLRQLNQVRVGFKHYGTLPDAREWYRVVDKVWSRVDEWCRAYLGVGLDEIDLEQLLADADVKRWYDTGKAEYRAGRYPQALEALGRALYEQLNVFPGMITPAVGRKNTEHALMLAAFGVRPSDYLTLQNFLPSVRYSWPASNVVVEWAPRGTGHEGNWTEANVRFCLETFLDLALKVQHAPPVPFAAPFEMIFDDVITPAGETADLFKWEFEQEPTLASLLTGNRKLKGRVVVRTLKSGERLRCRLVPAEVLDKRRTLADDLRLGDIMATANPTIDNAELLQIIPAESSGLEDSLFVESSAVRRSTAPKDDPFIRQLCPHLFGRSRAAPEEFEI